MIPQCIPYLYSFLILNAPRQPAGPEAFVAKVNMTHRFSQLELGPALNMQVLAINSSHLKLSPAVMEYIKL